MFTKHKKSLAFYAIITVVILFSIIADSLAQMENEADIRNTMGPPPSISYKVENFEVIDMQGNKLMSSELSGSYLLILWNLDDDGTSKSVFDDLNAMIEKGGCKNIDILPVNIGNSTEEIKKFIADNNYKYNFYKDLNKTTKWAFNFNKTQSYPISFIVDSEGTIVFRQALFNKSLKDRLLKRLEEYR